MQSGKQTRTSSILLTYIPICTCTVRAYYTVQYKPGNGERAVVHKPYEAHCAIRPSIGGVSTLSIALSLLAFFGPLCLIQSDPIATPRSSISWTMSPLSQRLFQYFRALRCT